jgi:hypothetical protein
VRFLVCFRRVLGRISRILAGVVALASLARADKLPPYHPPPEPLVNELGVHLTGQAGFAGTIGNPSGIKLSVEYAHRLREWLWLDFHLGNLFGFGATNGRCLGPSGQYCYGGGWALSLAGGVKFRFTAYRPLVIEVPALIGLDVLYQRQCGDTGAAVPVFKPGSRIAYQINEKTSVGVGFNFDLAPAYHASSAACIQPAYTDFYGAFEIAIGANFGF